MRPAPPGHLAIREDERNPLRRAGDCRGKLEQPPVLLSGEQIRAATIAQPARADADPLAIACAAIWRRDWIRSACRSRKPHAELDPRSYGFTDNDLDKPIFIDNVLGRETATLREILTILRETYCGPIGVEFMHIQDPEQKAWIQRKVEGAPWRTAFDAGAKRSILTQLTEAEGFEAFCQKRYVTTKRFGLEGGEVTIPAIHAIIETVASAGVSEIAIGMPHRGRLNTLVNIVKKPLTAVFSEFGGESFKPDDVQGFGRREIPPRHVDRHRCRRAQRASVAAAQPVASGGGRSGRDRQGACAPG